MKINSCSKITQHVRKQSCIRGSQHICQTGICIIPRICNNRISWERLKNKYVSNEELREEMETIRKEQRTLGEK